MPLDLRQSTSELKRKAAEDGGRDAPKKSKTTISQSFKGKNKIVILKSALTEGLAKRKTKGWHRLEFGLNEKLENDSKRFLNLNPMEKTQLLHEYELLSQHLKDTKMNKHRRRAKKNGKFKANNKNIKKNPISMDYFYYSWGVTRQTVSYLKKQKVQELMKSEMDELHANLFIGTTEKANKEEENNVIDSMEVAEKDLLQVICIVHHECEST